MRVEALTVEKHYSLPEVKEMQNGVLYVSYMYHVAIHLCACGCRSETVTPFNKEHYSWELTESSEGTVTLYPSIGNFNVMCQSHYWVRDGKIVWI